MDSKNFVVNIWSDFVCPWCWVAKRRFERALEGFEHKSRVQVNFKSFRLAPNHAVEPIKTVLVKKFGGVVGAESMMSSVRQQAVMEGLEYNFDTMLFGDTSDAHMLVKAVKDGGLQHQLVEALYEQSISFGKSIFDRSSLERIARNVGVPLEVIQRAWSSSVPRALMQKDERATIQMGTGVPVFVFDNEFYISGAQPLDVFQRALSRMCDLSEVDLETSNSQACGLDGCDL